MTDDVLVGYPTADRAALPSWPPTEGAGRGHHPDGRQHGRSSTSSTPWSRPADGPRLRVCLDLDASWRPSAAVAHRRAPLARCTRRPRSARSPPRSPGGPASGWSADVVRGADRRPRRRARPGGPSAAARSGPCSAGRTRSCWTAGPRRWPPRASTPTWSSSTAAARAASPRPRADPAVTEVTAGSGLYGPTLFDAYRAWRPTPAAYFATVGGPPAGARTGDRARRRLDRLRAGRTVPAAPARAARRADACCRPRAPARCRRRWRAGRGRPAGRRPGVVPPRQGRGAVRARRRAAPRARRPVERAVPTYRGEHAPAFL